MHTEFWLKTLKRRDCMEDIVCRWEDNINMDLKKEGVMM
jgi:hypothetical protein